jgi:uncharacterized damage-inducible protein DinB
MNKAEIIQLLNKKYKELFSWLEKHTDEEFEKNTAEKWSPGQHVDHLIKSTRPLNQALRMPKMALRTMFGKNNRDERNYTEVEKRYNEKIQAGGTASSKFLPKQISNSQKSALIDTLREELYNMTSILEKWDEKRLSKHLLPHPLLGKMTINEMMYFTIIHTEYHYRLLVRDYGE